MTGCAQHPVVVVKLLPCRVFVADFIWMYVVLCAVVCSEASCRPLLTFCINSLNVFVVNQSNQIAIAPICRKLMAGAWWWRLVRLFTVCDVDLQHMLEWAGELSSFRLLDIAVCRFAHCRVVMVLMLNLHRLMFGAWQQSMFKVCVRWVWYWVVNVC